VSCVEVKAVDCYRFWEQHSKAARP